jgi:hypothetical protein
VPDGESDGGGDRERDERDSECAGEKEIMNGEQKRETGPERQKRKESEGETPSTQRVQ